jgi:uncharacterized protein YdaU (DUF1376 family)
MNKPEIWMPFFGQDFDRDTKGWHRCDRWSYLAAIWAYWCDECRGLTDDDEMLRRVCECLSNAQADDWTACKQLIFGPKFKLGKDGLWHQARAKELYIEAQERLKAVSDRAKSGAKARWSKPCPSNAPAMLKHIPKQSLDGCSSNASSPSPSPSLERDSADAGIPTWEEVQTEASMHAVTLETAKSFFDYHQDNNLWLNGHKFLINWRSKLRNWQVRDRVTTTTGIVGKKPPSVWELTQQRDAIIEQMVKIEERGTPGAFGEIRPEDKAQMKALRLKRAEIQKQLTGVET